MPKFMCDEEGMLHFSMEAHTTDCGCGKCRKDPTDWQAWLSSEEDEDAPKWPDAEEEVANAAGCSMDVSQSLSPEEADKRLKKACKSRAAKLRRVSLLIVCINSH